MISPKKNYLIILKRVWLSPNYANSILGTEHIIKKLEINDLVKFIANITLQKFVLQLPGISLKKFIKFLKK